MLLSVRGNKVYCPIAHNNILYLRGLYGFFYQYQHKVIKMTVQPQLSLGPKTLPDFSDNLKGFFLWFYML